MEIKTSAWLQQMLIRLELLSQQNYQDQVTVLLDEQPFLMGFVFNLSEDFSEQTHELLVRSTVALEKSLAETGLFFDVISTEMLENTIDELIEKFEDLEAQGEAAFTEQGVLESASSPEALKSLYGFIDQNTTEVELPLESRSNLLLVLSAIIELLEQAATSEKPQQSAETNA